MRPLPHRHQLVQRAVNSQRVRVLRPLNEAHRQEADDRRAGSDDELPGIGVGEDLAEQPPVVSVDLWSDRVARIELTA